MRGELCVIGCVNMPSAGTEQYANDETDDERCGKAEISRKPRRAEWRRETGDHARRKPNEYCADESADCGSDEHSDKLYYAFHSWVVSVGCGFLGERAEAPNVGAEGRAALRGDEGHGTWQPHNEETKPAGGASRSSAGLDRHR